MMARTEEIGASFAEKSHIWYNQSIEYTRKRIEKLISIPPSFKCALCVSIFCLGFSPDKAEPLIDPNNKNEDTMGTELPDVSWKNKEINS